FSLQHKYPVSNERFYLELFGVPTLLYQFSNLGFIPPSFGPLWSVGVEILFSALFPLLIMLRTRLSMSQILAASLAVSILVQLSSHLFAYRGLQLGLPQHLFNFALGMAACEVVSRPAAFPRLGRLLDWITPFLPLPLLAALLVLSIKDTASSHMLANLTFSFSATALVMALGVGKAPVLCSLLENPRLQLIGAMCYSIYLWHVPMLLGLFPGFATNTDWHAVVPYAPLYLALLFAVSALSYRYIEFPNAEVRSLFFLGMKPAKPLSRPTSPLLEPIVAVTEVMTEAVTTEAAPEQASF
ncbi:MAG TPA: acyltransferase, partial [Stellaceae bacterium]|nr:acyltransferase [Stellaceae bacterium]